MSGVTDFVSKAFKSVKKVATKLWDNKIIRAVIIAVAVYYTAGLASQAGWFAPAAGQGAAGASAVSTGTTFTTVATESAIAEGGLTLTGSTGGVAGAGGAVTAGTADALALGGATAGTGGATAGGVVTGAEFAGTAGAEMAAGAGVAGAAPTVAAAAPAAASPGIVGSTMGWMQANPMATMMLGQGVSGAVASHEADKAEQRRIDQENLEFERRGTMGYDTSGRYAGAPGIVASQVAAPRAAAAPAVSKVRPIERKNLAELHNQGLVRSQQRA